MVLLVGRLPCEGVPGAFSGLGGVRCLAVRGEECEGGEEGFSMGPTSSPSEVTIFTRRFDLNW